MKLSVIIVNYNVQYFLEQALLSVRKASSGLAVEVFVVDNNSVDDSVNMVREKFPEVNMIPNKSNPGFAKANNQAIRQAQGEYILLLNPDTVVEEDTFEKCLAFMDEHPEAGGLGVRMIDGSGKFLPESKRGFPDPWVAFCKTFGLSRIFNKSRIFNHYHLGYLPEKETNEVEVLAGAYMWLRKSVLDEIGLLDEAFFMYGEDIDLSYRIIQAGYKNYYLPSATIIHYKGESTKKGSLNYVKTFYQAMIIFARKHFRGPNARLFVGMLQLAIYLRAFLTIFTGFFKRIALPLADGLILFGGLWLMKHFWAVYHFKDPDYYEVSFLYFNAPLYTLLWLGAIFFSGGYDEPWNLRRLFRGLLVGSLIISAVYGFLDMAYRNSRALIVLGALWSLGALGSFRLLLHFLLYKNFAVGRERRQNLAIVGSESESERVQQLLQSAQIQKNLIGNIAASEENQKGVLGYLDQLDEIVHIYKLDELIFCSKDIPSQQIMHWMSRLGPGIEYKILPQESISIIGSSSKNAAGELYTIDIRFNIAQPLERRNKRVLDILLALGLLISWPLQLFLVKKPLGLLKNIFQVIGGQKSWVGYKVSTALNIPETYLPSIRPGILSPVHGLQKKDLTLETEQRLNFLYAKDYRTGMDLEIIWRAWGELGG